MSRHPAKRYVIIGDKDFYKLQISASKPLVKLVVAREHEGSPV